MTAVHKKLIFTLRISSVNVSKSAGICLMENFIFCAAEVVSISKRQLEIRLGEFRKLCLNLCSGRERKLYNFIRCSIPLVSKQLYLLLGEGLINFRILFLQILRLSEFRIDLSRLLHSINVEGKKVF